MGDLRVPVAPLLTAFGLAITVTRPAPDNTPIATTGIWVGGWVAETQPYGADFRRREPRRRLDVVRAAVPTMPSGTLIAAPEVKGGAVKTWQFEGFTDEQDDPDFWRVFVKRV